MKAREVKRARLCAKYAEKRKALKEAGDWAALDRLPKNSSPCRQPPDVPKAICVFSASAVFSSARWPARVLSPAFARHPGKRIHLT